MDRVTDFFAAHVLGTVLATCLVLLVLGTGYGARRGLLQKELRHFFYSPIAYVVTAGFLFINGFVFLFVVDYYRSGSPNDPPVRLFFGNGFWWIMILIVVPAITMRLFAQEKASGTIEPLLTAPVREGEVVVAKYLASFYFYCFLWLPTLIFVFLLYKYADPTLTLDRLTDGTKLYTLTGWQEVYGRLNKVMDLGPILTGYLGTLAMGAAFLGIGCLTSSLARDQVVAYILGFVALLFLFSVGFLDSIVQTDPSWFPGLKKTIQYVSFMEHFKHFPLGIVDTRPLVYYGTIIVITLFLSARVLESRKWRG